MESPTLITTADGSNSLISNQFLVAYHSQHGAIQESNHVFIEAGFLAQYQKNHLIKVLEIGFGTGLNALMTYIEAQKLQVNVAYSTLEPYPISWSLAKKLNYLSIFKAKRNSVVFQQMHCHSFDEWHSIDKDFRFRKINADASTFSSHNLYNLIYFDAFAPETQPELWTEDVFRRLYNMMDNEGILVTYCAKGAVKRTLKKVGFEVEALPGPPGKREMTRAIKR